MLLIKIAIFAVAFKGEKRMTYIATAIVERAINIGGAIKKRNILECTKSIDRK